MFIFRLNCRFFTAAVAAQRSFHKIKAPCRDSFCRWRYAPLAEGGGARLPLFPVFCDPQLISCIAKLPFKTGDYSGFLIVN